MQPYVRNLAVLSLLIGLLGTDTALGVTSEVVFDNTSGETFGVFGPSCCQVGNEITLGGSDREIVLLSWGIETQGANLLAQMESQIYANDGPGGIPGTLLWTSGLMTDIFIRAGDTTLDFVVPNVAVPDTVTITSRILGSSPLALGRRTGGATTIGNIITTWSDTTTIGWAESFSPWAMRVEATSSSAPVPEPFSATLGILTIGALGVATKRRAHGSPR